MNYFRWKDEDWDKLIFSIRNKNCILMLGPEASLEKNDGKIRPILEILSKELANKIEKGQEQKTSSLNIDHTNLGLISQLYSMQEGRDGLEEKVFSFFTSKKREEYTKLHENLADLPFYFTITSSPDRMFYNALKKADKNPTIERYHFCGKNPEIVTMGTGKNPLLFYLNGIIQEPDSLVLTENDLVDFLVAVVSNNPHVPANILSELHENNKSFLFLGFGFKHWYLRILLHVLQGKERKRRSFALERFPKDSVDFENTIYFFREDSYRIYIYDQDLNAFVKKLSVKYKNKSRVGENGDNGTPEPPTIFICHTSEDQDYASALQESIENAGFKTWLDKKNLRGGDKWDEVIERTLKTEIDYVLILQSSALSRVIKRYVNSEIAIAKKIQKYFKPGIRFIIPAKIEMDCFLRKDLEDLHTIDLSNINNIKELVTAIERDQTNRKGGY